MSRRSRPVLTAAAAVAVGAGAYAAVHRVGVYDRDNPLAGWTPSSRRSRPARPNASATCAMPSASMPVCPRPWPRGRPHPAAQHRLPVTSEPLTPEQAKALLLDLAGPPGPGRRGGRLNGIRPG